MTEYVPKKEALNRIIRWGQENRYTNKAAFVGGEYVETLKKVATTSRELGDNLIITKEENRNSNDMIITMRRVRDASIDGVVVYIVQGIVSQSKRVDYHLSSNPNAADFLGIKE